MGLSSDRMVISWIITRQIIVEIAVNEIQNIFSKIFLLLCEMFWSPWMLLWFMKFPMKAWILLILTSLFTFDDFVLELARNSQTLFRFLCFLMAWKMETRIFKIISMIDIIDIPAIKPIKPPNDPKNSELPIDFCLTKGCKKLSKIAEVRIVTSLKELINFLFFSCSEFLLNVFFTVHAVTYIFTFAQTFTIFHGKIFSLKAVFNCFMTLCIFNSTNFGVWTSWKLNWSKISTPSNSLTDHVKGNAPTFFWS